MIVGQAPGRVEAVETRLPFSGSAGRRLFRWLAQAGWDEVDFRAGQYMTAITKCFPGPHPQGRGDRVPSKAECELCRPWLEQELALVTPRIVLPIGTLAIQRFWGRKARLLDVVGRPFRRPDDDAVLAPWAQRHLPHTAILLALPHPSGASQWLNQPENQMRLQQALDHLSALREQVLMDSA